MKSRGDKKWRRRWLAIRRATLDGGPDHPLLTGSERIGDHRLLGVYDEVQTWNRGDEPY